MDGWRDGRQGFIGTLADVRNRLDKDRQMETHTYIYTYIQLYIPTHRHIYIYSQIDELTD